MSRKKIKVRELTISEETARYGERRIKINKCFREGHHFYKQKTDHVLHVNTKDKIINNLHVGVLNLESGMKEISEDDFTLIMKKLIFEMEINEFWKPQ